MSIVLSVTKRRGAVCVTLDEGAALVIPTALYRERKLMPGDAVDTAHYRAFIAERGYALALDCAVKFLAARPRTEREVRRRLTEAGYPDEAADRVVERLKRERYLNDAQFADLWVEARGQRAVGSRRIAQELSRKGVDKETAQTALSNLDEDEQARIAAEHAKKLLARTRGKDEADVRRKVYAALIRRGYGYDEAKRALAAAGQEIEDEE